LPLFSFFKYFTNPKQTRLLPTALPKELFKHIAFISIISQKKSKSEKRRFTEVEQTWDVFNTMVVKNYNGLKVKVIVLCSSFQQSFWIIFTVNRFGLFLFIAVIISNPYTFTPKR